MPDCAACPPPFASGSYADCQCNALRWRRASAESVRGFSATGWFTGAALHRLLGATLGEPLAGVPLGLLRSSWGGTMSITWSSADALAKCPPGDARGTGSLDVLAEQDGHDALAGPGGAALG